MYTIVHKIKCLLDDESTTEARTFTSDGISVCVTNTKNGWHYVSLTAGGMTATYGFNKYTIENDAIMVYYDMWCIGRIHF